MKQAEPAGGRFVMEVVTVTGRAAAVEFRLRRDRVEIWHDGRCSAVLVRDDLRRWLADPGGPLAVGEVAFSFDRIVDTAGRIALTLPDVSSWTLAPTALAELRDLV